MFLHIGDGMANGLACPGRHVVVAVRGRQIGRIKSG